MNETQALMLALMDAQQSRISLTQEISRLKAENDELKKAGEDCKNSVT